MATNPGALFRQEPDDVEYIETDPESVEETQQAEFFDGLHRARMHAASNHEFLTVILNPFQSVKVLGFDASRKKVTIAPFTQVIVPGSTNNIVASFVDLSGILNPNGYTSAAATLNFPGVYLSSFNSAIELESQEELWLYNICPPASPSVVAVSLIVERYSSGV